MNTHSHIKIGVIGLGPVGQILGVSLKSAGFEVLLCDNDRLKVNQIRKEGIRLENAIQKSAQFENVFSSAEDLIACQPDYVFISVKTYQVEGLLKGITNFGNTFFVCAQNGIDVEQLLTDKVSEDKILRLVINFAGNVLSPNVVRCSFFHPPNYLAPLDDAAGASAETLADCLTKAGLTTERLSSFEIAKRVWEKTILNSSLSALCGIGRFTMSEAMAFPDTIELIEQIIAEAAEVAEAEKIRFPDDFIRSCLRYLKKAGNHYPSLASDLMNNRPTEIDFMNGKIVEYGRKHYIRTSLNLSMVNMVKAMTLKCLSVHHGKQTESSQQGKQLSAQKSRTPVGNCFLGIDLGSAFSKITVIDERKQVVFRHLFPTVNRDKIAVRHVLDAIFEEFPIVYSCATGYGRKNFPDADLIKTEIHCAALGCLSLSPGAKNILDIGGEDIKVIHCDENGFVENFYLNDKCAAGTGSFITEIAARADIDVREMSDLAQKSDSSEGLNSFCTVFAKTEIMKWVIEGKPIQNISRGIYLSIISRISKMRIDPNRPLVMIGGVVAHHPFLASLVEEKHGQQALVPENAQFVVSFGAALMALQAWSQKTIEQLAEQEKSE